MCMSACCRIYDRGQLNQGVYVKDYEELINRIEDYIS